jgi:hypothetical protein
MKIITAFSICVCACAQSGVNRPQLGKMLDSNGAVRTVYGIAASVTLGDMESTDVLSSACSKTFCLAKTETSIVSAVGSVDAPPGPAMFAFDGDAAFVWFSRSRQLARWQNGLLTLIDSSVEGEVLSIGANVGVVQFAVRRMNGVWVINQDGSVAGSLPHATRAAILIPGGVVFATREEIVIGDLRFSLNGVTEFSQMSDSYLQVRAGGADYSLRIEKGRETLFQLPGVPR